MFAEYPDVVTVQEVAKMLRISNAKAYELAKSGKVKMKSFGRRYVVTKQSVIDYLRDGMTE